MAATYPSDAKQWLAKLISFDTTSRNSNLDLIHYVRDYLQSVGITPVLVHNEERTKANLFATLPGVDGERQGGVVLSGHTDVVPVDGQDWATDPFVMVEKDGKLYGRGSADMKGGIAVVLALTPHFLSMPGRTKPIHYAFSFDEEVGCTGVPFLIDHLRREGFKADGCLILEPTDLLLFSGNKSSHRWRVIVRGQAIHSSMALMNTSCNAIEHAAMIITKVREIAIKLRDQGPRDDAYTCPFSPISTGIIKGGNAMNTVPAECVFGFSVRVADAAVADSIEHDVRAYVESVVLPAMRAEYAEASVEIIKGKSYPPFNNNDEDSELVRTARRLRNDTVVRKLGPGTEAGYFHGELGISTLIVGPGSISMAHKANEYTPVEQMVECERFTLDLCRDMCSRNRPSHC